MELTSPAEAQRLCARLEARGVVRGVRELSLSYEPSRDEASSSEGGGVWVSVGPAEEVALEGEAAARALVSRTGAEQRFTVIGADSGVPVLGSVRALSVDRARWLARALAAACPPGGLAQGILVRERSAWTATAGAISSLHSTRGLLRVETPSGALVDGVVFTEQDTEATEHLPSGPNTADDPAASPGNARGASIAGEHGTGANGAHGTSANAEHVGDTSSQRDARASGKHSASANAERAAGTSTNAEHDASTSANAERAASANAERAAGTSTNAEHDAGADGAHGTSANAGHHVGAGVPQGSQRGARAGSQGVHVASPGEQRVRSANSAPLLIDANHAAIEALAARLRDAAEALDGAGGPLDPSLPWLFRPLAAGPLIAALGWLLRGDTAGRSPGLARAIGKKLFPSALTLRDTPEHAQLDDEGRPAADVTLIQDGRLAAFLHSTASAAPLGHAPNGRAFRPEPGAPIAGAPLRLHVAPGAAPLTADANELCARLETFNPMPRAGVVSVILAGWVRRGGRRVQRIAPFEVELPLLDTLRKLLAVGDDLAFLPGSEGCGTPSLLFSPLTA